MKHLAVGLIAGVVFLGLLWAFGEIGSALGSPVGRISILVGLGIVVLVAIIDWITEDKRS